MKAQSLIAAGAGIVLLIGMTSCTDPRSTPGYDQDTQSTASPVTWTDGKPALSIQCNQPQGCQTRALAMCKGNFTPLSMENMPTRGDMTVVRGPASVVVRCAGSA